MGKYSFISDIAFLNSRFNSTGQLNNLFNDNIFSDNKNWNDHLPDAKIDGPQTIVDSRMRNRMSQLSLGIYNVLKSGPGQNINSDEEIIQFTGFGEIETTKKIVDKIIIDNFKLVSPTLFHNSVHHTALGYYSIINKIHNPCITISDGMRTNLSFIDFIKNKVQVSKRFIVTAGDEHSDFYKIDKENNYKIYPTFMAYRITSNNSNGFRYLGVTKDVDHFIRTNNYGEIKYIFVDKNTFNQKLFENNISILTDFPLTYDSPCSIIYRLALPFIFKIKGISLVIEKTENDFHVFEVKI